MKLKSKKKTASTSRRTTSKGTTRKSTKRKTASRSSSSFNNIYGPTKGYLKTKKTARYGKTDLRKRRKTKRN